MKNPSTVLEILGLITVSVGVGLIYPPAGVIVGGVLKILLGYLLGAPPATPPVDNSHSESSA